MTLELHDSPGSGTYESGVEGVSGLAVSVGGTARSVVLTVGAVLVAALRSRASRALGSGGGLLERLGDNGRWEAEVSAVAFVSVCGRNQGYTNRRYSMPESVSVQ